MPEVHAAVEPIVDCQGQDEVEKNRKIKNPAFYLILQKRGRQAHFQHFWVFLA